MQQSTTTDTVSTIDSSGQEARDVLTEILRHGAQQMLAAAIENEVAEYIGTHAQRRDEKGQRLVVRNGHMPPRSILTGLGAVEVVRPRVNDRRVDADGNRMRFTSRILPPYLRRTKAIDELVPWLYLKGVSTGDCQMLFMTFGDVQRPVVVCGLTCEDRLQALQRIMEHEIIHLGRTARVGSVKLLGREVQGPGEEPLRPQRHQARTGDGS